MTQHMRTTIEIGDDTLRKLREPAARRGEKGYSRIVEEALGAYFGGRPGGPGDNRTREESLRALEGSISDEEAEELRRSGTPLDAGDLLIAGVARANNLAIITRNVRHFSRIDGLALLDPALT